MGSKLYQREKYTTESRYENAVIREYDIRDAGFNIIKQYKLLPQSKIDELGAMDKQERKRAIGILQINDKALARALIKGFESARKEFFEANEIEDWDVVSIKKDAIFVKDKVCVNVDFGHIHFSIKNKYNAFLYLNDIEFYYNDREDILDVKGISDELLDLHKDGMLKLIKNILTIVTESNEKFVCSKLQKLVVEYKNHELPVDTYRELNRYSKFKVQSSLIFSRDIYVDTYELVGDSDIDISFNFAKFILPIIGIFY